MTSSPPGPVPPPAELLEYLSSPAAPLIAGHVNPDADCLGSMLALAGGLTRVAGTVVPCGLPAGSISRKLQFLMDFAPDHIASEQTCRQAGPMIACDTARPGRINLPQDVRQSRRPIVNIDHHASNTQFGDINWIDATASSTAEMICRLFTTLRWTISPEIATLLFAGIHGDTVGFSLSNTTPEALRAAADLAQAGARIDLVGEHLWRRQSSSEFRLRRIVYDNTRLSDSGRIAYSSANYDEITTAGCTAADIDDQVEIPRSLAGAELAILFTEGKPGRVRINLRSRSGISALDLARQIGGGGHVLAAGAIMDGSVPEVIDKLIPLADQYLARTTSSAPDP